MFEVNTFALQAFTLQMVNTKEGRHIVIVSMAGLVATAKSSLIRRLLAAIGPNAPGWNHAL